MPVLRTANLLKHYHSGDETIHAVDGVSLTIEPGEIVALYGPSGSGKTTLIDLIAGLQRPDSGMIEVEGRSIASFTEREHADYLRLTVGIIGQANDLIAAATARQNACLKLLREHPRTAAALIEPLLVQLGLSDRIDQPVEQLSMGERQRVVIAQALATQPRLVLADEPTGSLDTRRSREVLGLIRSLSHEKEMAVLLVTHDPQALRFADRAQELRDGRLQDYEPEREYLRSIGQT